MAAANHWYEVINCRYRWQADMSVRGFSADMSVRGCRRGRARTNQKVTRVHNDETDMCRRVSVRGCSVAGTRLQCVSMRYEVAGAGPIRARHVSKMRC